MMEKYDGWALKNCYGRKPFLVFDYLRKTKKEVIKEIECSFDDHWENIKKRHQFKIVKVRLVEV